MKDTLKKPSREDKLKRYEEQIYSISLVYALEDKKFNSINHLIKIAGNRTTNRKPYREAINNLIETFVLKLDEKKAPSLNLDIPINKDIIEHIKKDNLQESITIKLLKDLTSKPEYEDDNKKNATKIYPEAQTNLKIINSNKLFLNQYNLAKKYAEDKKIEAEVINELSKKNKLNSKASKMI